MANLPISSTAGTPASLCEVRAAQGISANLTTADHAKFTVQVQQSGTDVLPDLTGSYSTAVGPSLGRFFLKGGGGRIYSLIGSLGDVQFATLSGNNYVSYQWYDVTSNTAIGTKCTTACQFSSSPSYSGSGGDAIAIFKPLVDSWIELRIIGNSNLTAYSGTMTSQFARAIVELVSSDVPLTVPSLLAGAVTKSYPFSQTVAKGDPLELWNDAGIYKARKAAQVTNTVAAVYNQTLSGTGLNRTGTYNWRDGSTFRTMEVIYNSPSNVAVSTWGGALSAGTFGTFTASLSNLTLSGVYNISATGTYQGCVAENYNGTGDLLFVLPGGDGLYIWRLSRSGASLSAYLKVNSTPFNSAYAVPIGVDEWYVVGVTNGGALTGMRVLVSGGNPTLVDNSTLAASGYGVAAGGNWSYSATASGSTRWGFYFRANPTYTLYDLVALAGVSGNNSYTSTVKPMGNLGSSFGASLGLAYRDSAKAIVALWSYSSNNVKLIGFTPASAIAGTFSNTVEFTSGTIGYRGIVPLTGNRFLLLTTPVSSATLICETFNLDPATLTATLVNTQNFAIPVSAEKEIITGSQLAYDSNGSGILSIASGADPHYLVGYTNAFVGVINPNVAGLAKDAVLAGAVGDVSLSGDVITGMSGLTPGARYYLNPTSGLRQTAVTSTPLSYAISPTEEQVRL